MSKQKKQKLLKRMKDRIVNPETNGIRRVPIMVHILFGLMILGGGMLYLVEVNETSTQGFKIHSLEQKIEKLEGIQKELEFRQTEAGSLGALTEEAKKLNLVAVDRVESLTQTGDLALGR